MQQVHCFLPGQFPAPVIASGSLDIGVPGSFATVAISAFWATRNASTQVVRSLSRPDIILHINKYLPPFTSEPEIKNAPPNKACLPFGGVLPLHLWGERGLNPHEVSLDRF